MYKTKQKAPKLKVATIPKSNSKPQKHKQKRASNQKKSLRAIHTKSKKNPQIPMKIKSPINTNNTAGFSTIQNLSNTIHHINIPTTMKENHNNNRRKKNNISTPEEQITTTVKQKFPSVIFNSPQLQQKNLSFPYVPLSSMKMNQQQRSSSSSSSIGSGLGMNMNGLMMNNQDFLSQNHQNGPQFIQNRSIHNNNRHNINNKGFFRNLFGGHGNNNSQRMKNDDTTGQDNGKMKTTSSVQTYESSYSVDDKGMGRYNVIEGQSMNSAPMKYHVSHGIVDGRSKNVYVIDDFSTNDPSRAYDTEGFAEKQRQFLHDGRVSDTKQPKIASYRQGNLGQKAVGALEEGEKQVSSSQSSPSQSPTSKNGGSFSGFSPTRSSRSDAVFGGNYNFDVAKEVEILLKENRKLSETHRENTRQIEELTTNHWKHTWE